MLNTTRLLAKKLARLGKVSAIDCSSEAIKFAGKNGVNARRGSINKLPYNNNHFDLITCVDVIYHSRVNDVAALGEMRRVLKSGGVLILRVPANKYLVSAHDVHVHTARRYGKDELKRKLRLAGFRVRCISFVHLPIFPISLFRVIWERLTHRVAASSIRKINPVLNSILAVVLKLEAEMISRGVIMPLGQGLIAVATPNRQSNPGQKMQ